MAIEFARNVLGMKGANSLEFDPKCAPNDVVTLLDSQREVYLL